MNDIGIVEAELLIDSQRAVIKLALFETESGN
jgi:hypothetical protein